MIVPITMAAGIGLEDQGVTVAVENIVVTRAMAKNVAVMKATVVDLAVPRVTVAGIVAAKTMVADIAVARAGIDNGKRSFRANRKLLLCF